MKFPTNFESSGYLGRPCTINDSTSIIMMNCQSSKGLLKAPQNHPFFNNMHSMQTRQFHVQAQQRKTSPAAATAVIDMHIAKKICHHTMLTYADVVKLLPAVSRLPQHLNHIMSSSHQLPPPVPAAVVAAARPTTLPSKVSPFYPNSPTTKSNKVTSFCPATAVRPTTMPTYVGPATAVRPTTMPSKVAPFCPATAVRPTTMPSKVAPSCPLVTASLIIPATMALPHPPTVLDTPTTIPSKQTSPQSSSPIINNKRTTIEKPPIVNSRPKTPYKMSHSPILTKLNTHLSIPVKGNKTAPTSPPVLKMQYVRPFKVSHQNFSKLSASNAVPSKVIPDLCKSNSKCTWRIPSPSPPPPPAPPLVKTVPSSSSFHQCHRVPEKIILSAKGKTVIITSPPQSNRSKWKKQNTATEPASTKKVFLPNKKPRTKNKFWQKTPNILASSWRTSSSVESECKDEQPRVEREVQRCVAGTEPKTTADTSASQSVTELAGQAQEYAFRPRQQSESSQTSEDSVVVFERDPSCCYASEVSSCESDSGTEDSDTDSTLSDSSISSVSHLADSGLTTESEDEEEEGPILQVGDSARLSLPPLPPLPPVRLSSLSDTDDDDDDFIVFGSDSEQDSCDEEVESDAGEDEMDSLQRKRSDVKVRFAAKEEICYLYDDDDHRLARCGEWEEMARDRSRFRARIASTAEVLSPVLSPEHRQQVYSKRVHTDCNGTAGDCKTS